jgi:hypothetical protein
MFDSPLTENDFTRDKQAIATLDLILGLESCSFSVVMDSMTTNRDDNKEYLADCIFC